MTKNNVPAKQTETGFSIVDNPQSAQTIQAAFTEFNLTAADLTRLKIPAGGSIAWEVDTLGETKAEQNLDVIILGVEGNQKAWWATSVDDSAGDNAPSCISTDGINGTGINSLDPTATTGTHKCSECAWNQFESSRSGGRGKDCKDTSIVFFVLGDEALPHVLTVPATSLKVVKKYAMQLLSRHIEPSSVITRLTLEKAMSGGGHTYSKLAMSKTSDLSEEQADKTRGIAKNFMDRITGGDSLAGFASASEG